MGFLGFFVAQRVDAALAADQREFVERGDGMTSADIAGVNLVVVEILAVELAVLVADLAVFPDHGRVELDLHFHVAGNSGQRRGHFVDQHLVPFHQIVDVGIRAVANIGDLLHHGFVIVAGAKTEGGKRNTGFALFLDHALELRGVGNPDIEIAVGSQQDAVDPVLDESLLRGAVGQLQAGSPSSAAAGAQGVDGGIDRCFFAAGSRGQNHLRAGGVGHQCDTVLCAHLVNQQLERALQQGQLVRRAH